MTVVYESEKSFWLASSAVVLDDNPTSPGHEMAWAERRVHKNPAIKWILGKYVEADKANNNRQYWSHGDLQLAQPTILHAPMNMLHQPRRIVGAFVDTEMLYPTGETAADGQNPYIEALGAFWKFYFPEELAMVERAFSEGQLFYSMECVADTITCAGEGGCSQEFAYKGPTNPSYCEHLNQGVSIKRLNSPHFLAGALLTPPISPGWSNAFVTELSSLVKENADVCERAYEGISAEVAGDSKIWEDMMLQIVALSNGLIAKR